MPTRRLVQKEKTSGNKSLKAAPDSAKCAQRLKKSKPIQFV